MPERIKQAVQRMNELQIAFLAKLGDKVKELSRLILQVDITSNLNTPENHALLHDIHQLAHNLAGSAGTFKHTTVYHKAKAIENLISELLQKPYSEVTSDWHKVLLELIVGLRGDIQISGRPSVVENFSFKIDPLTPKFRNETELAPLSPIIIVDDDELLVNLIKEQAKHFGYQVIPLLSTADLQEALVQYHPEAILIDVIFPDAKHSGIEIINQLKAQKKINCPVIFISNRSDIVVRLDALRAGSDAFIVKPLDILELIRILDRLTQKLAKTKSKLLIVDDDPLTAKFYQTAFNSQDFCCEVIINPMEVINKALTFNPDAILLDVHMPGCDGFELAQIIRQDNNFTHIPLLFLTSHSNNKGEVSALAAGGDDYLDKNADLPTLTALIKGHVQRYKELNSVFNRLKKEEILFRSVTSSSNDAIISVDSKGRIVFWNEGAENIFGYRALETIGQSMNLIIPQEQSDCFNRLVTGKAPLPSKYAIEIVAIKKDNTLIDVELTYSQITTGNEKFYTLIIRDITHKKQLEQELYNKEMSLNAIISSSGEAIITTDKQGIIETANPKAIQLFGYARQELIGKNIASLITALEVEKLSTTKKQPFELTDSVDQTQECYGIRSNGSVFTLEVNIAPMKVAGQPKFVSILHDISERKHFINELLLAKAGAEAASKAKTQFLSSMSHELRTPLNAILGFTQLLQTDEELSLNTEQQESLHHIYSSGVHLLALINNVLALSRIESGIFELHLERFALVPFVNEIIKQHEIRIATTGLQINYLENEKNVLVELDKDKLKQVIDHLLSNAIKYNRQKGAIHISLTATEHKACLFISDTGKGISKHRIPELFKPFSRLDAEIGTIGGAGIGLVLSKKLLEIMDCKIGVDSKEEKGSTFWIELDRVY